MSATFGHPTVQQPPPDQFADMLELVFVGPVEGMEPPEVLSEEVFTPEELHRAIGRLKTDKAPDEAGLAAEL